MKARGLYVQLEPVSFCVYRLFWLLWQGQESNEDLRAKAMTLLGRFIAVKVSVQSIYRWARMRDTVSAV